MQGKFFFKTLSWRQTLLTINSAVVVCCSKLMLLAKLVVCPYLPLLFYLSSLLFSSSSPFLPFTISTSLFLSVLPFNFVTLDYPVCSPGCNEADGCNCPFPSSYFQTYTAPSTNLSLVPPTCSCKENYSGSRCETYGILLFHFSNNIGIRL